MSNKTLVSTTVLSAFVFFVLISFLYSRVSPLVQKAIGFDSTSINRSNNANNNVEISDTLASSYITENSKQSSTIEYFLNTQKFNNINEAKKVFFREYDNENPGVIKTIPMTVTENGNNQKITAEFLLPPQTFYRYSTIENNCLQVTFTKNSVTYLTMIIDGSSNENSSECLEGYKVESNQLKEFLVLGKNDNLNSYIIRTDNPDKNFKYSFISSTLINNSDNRTSFTPQYFNNEKEFVSTTPSLSNTGNRIKYTGFISEAAANNSDLLKQADLAFYSFSFENN